MKATGLSPIEYLPYYANYINLAGHISLLEGLNNGRTSTSEFFKSIPHDKLEFRYSEGKWTIKEILQHIIDTERVFSYRALRFARKDKTALPGFEQNSYSDFSEANDRQITDQIEEYNVLRQATTALFSSFNEGMLKRIGKASGGPMSARAAGFVIIGHEIHHIDIIKKRYL